MKLALFVARVHASLAITMLLCGNAAAQANYHATPLGGRSALLGGTGVALGVDGAAPFLNPAAIVRISDRRISFSARFFRLSQLTLLNLRQPGPVDPAYGPLELENPSLSSTTLRTAPDTTCYFFSRSGGESAQLSGRSKLALCLAKTEEHEFDVTARNYHGESAGRRIDQSQSFREAWGSWSFGPTFAIYVLNDVAIGASLHVTRTRHQTTSSVATVAQDLTSDAIVSSTYQSADSGSSWDSVMQLGMTYKLSRRITLGASFRTPSLHLTGDYSAAEDARFDSNSSLLSHWGGKGSFVVRTPVRVNAGIGMEFERFRFEANAFFHAGRSQFARAELERDLVSSSNGQLDERTRQPLIRNESVHPVFNCGLGSEYFMSKNLSLLSGIASDFNALSELSAEDSDRRLFHSRFDAWHAGLGISSYTDFGDLVFGLRGDYLRGKVSAVNGFAEPAERDLIPAREWAVTLILAGRISLSSVAEAAEHVSQAVSGEAPAPGAVPRKPLQPPKKD